MINGKRYIGQKKFDVGSRWKSYLGGGSYLKKAQKKYGIENFARTIVDIAYSRDELNKLEERWIKDCDAVNSDDYYNQIDGGTVDDALIRNNSLPCICIDNGVVFNSLVDASLWSGLTINAIKKSFNHKHSVENYRNEKPIFRLLTDDLIEQSLCVICGNVIASKRGNQKRCESHLLKKVGHGKRRSKKTIYMPPPRNSNDKQMKKNKRDHLKDRRYNLIEINKSVIITLYIEQKYSIGRIVEKLNNGLSYQTIKEALTRWGVYVKNRDKNVNIKKSYVLIVDKHSLVVLKKFEYKYQVREWLYNTYGISINASRLNYIINKGGEINKMLVISTDYNKYNNMEINSAFLW